MNWEPETHPRCDVCGRFIGHKDLMSGTARYEIITPDSDVSLEWIETLCPTHNTPEIRNVGMYERREG